jgi:tartrate-resistant acid phosphatase type 5
MRYSRRLHGVVLGLAAMIAGCGSEAQSTTTTADGGAATTGTAGAGGEGAGMATGTGGAGAGTMGNGGGGAGTGTGGAAPEPTLRFVALGDGGEGNTTQYKVAEVAKNVCEAKGGCEFALYLGDNIYNSGVSGTDDDQFQTKFEMPYSILDFPFYVVLGNHDYGGEGAGFEFWKAEAQVGYTEISSKWTMPERFYLFSTPADAGPPDGPSAMFLGLDTNAIMWTGDGDQKSWLDGALAAAPAGWKIGFGHHPYVSNGKHGNAGEYEGFSWLPIADGENVKEFFDDAVCGKVDVYISGHDHNRQWLEPACGTEFIVSGTAAKTTELVGHGTPTFFETDQKGGLLLVELTATTFKGTFYDEDGAEEFSRTITK